MNNLIELIEKIKILVYYQKKIKQLSDDNFNIFRICGVNHYENTHSSILVELLSNNSSHSFDNRFLEAFIETLKKEKLVKNDFHFIVSNVQVFREYSTPFGRIDIFIKNDSQCIIIENKIYADDQYEQLKRYDAYAKSQFGENYVLLYLTLWGDEAADHSGEGINYKPISYNHLIVYWLERCVEISARNSIIRETLIQYINHIKYLTDNNTNKIMNEEIIILLSQSENVEATFTIGENLDNVKNYLINKVFLRQLITICSELRLQCDSKEYDRVNTSWAGFDIRNPDWKFFKFGFEFEAKGLISFIIGLNYKNDEMRNDETFEKLKAHFRRNNANWVWNDFPKYSTWGKDAMIAIINGEMSNIIKTEIEKILELTKEFEM